MLHGALQWKARNVSGRCMSSRMSSCKGGHATSIQINPKYGAAKRSPQVDCTTGAGQGETRQARQAEGPGKTRHCLQDEPRNAAPRHESSTIVLVLKPFSVCSRPTQNPVLILGSSCPTSQFSVIIFLIHAGRLLKTTIWEPGTENDILPFLPWARRRPRKGQCIRVDHADQFGKPIICSQLIE